MYFEKERMKKTNSLSMKNIHVPKKEILFDIDKDKYFLKIEDNIKFYETNKFGKKKPKINLSQTGLATYNDRILTNSIDKINFKIDDSLYHPQSLRFEGYSQFPRPLIIPFSNNITKIKIYKNLIDELRKTDSYFTTSKNKNILNKKTNEGLSFFSGTINNIVNKKNKQYVVNKINDALSYDENKNIFSNQEKMTNYQKNALKKLKNKILKNSTNTVFGRKLKKPDDKFYHQFKINYNIYFKNPIKKNILKKKEKEEDNKLYFEELYKTLNKRNFQKRLKLTKDKNNLEILNNINNNNIKNKNTHSCIDKKESFINETKTTNYNENKEFTPRYNNNVEKKNKNKKNIYKTQENDKELIKADISKDFFNTLYKVRKKNFDCENESIEKYKIPLSESERYYNMNISIYNKSQRLENNNNIDIRTFSDLSKNCYIEKKLLMGFIKPELKERRYRKNVSKYKSTINIYKKEWELEKIVNPLRYKLEEEKKIKELNLIKEKLNKGKDFSSFGIKKSKKNKLYSTFNLSN